MNTCKKIVSLTICTVILLMMFSIAGSVPLRADAATSLAAPKITAFASTDDGVKVTWGSVSGAQKYRLFYKNGSGGWTKIGDTTGTTLTDTVVSSGGRYTYTVRCLNSAATAYTSGYDADGWKYTYNMATPSITSHTSTADGVKLVWGSVTNAKKYRVFYKNGSGGWSKLGDTTGTSMVDSIVTVGKTYTYTVRCLKSDGSRYTSSYNATGWKHTYDYSVNTPKINNSSSSSSGIKLSWNSVGAPKYRVFYKNRNGGWSKLGDTTGTSIVDSEVSYGKTYTYTVRALDASSRNYISGYDAAGWNHTHYLNIPQITAFSSTSQGVKITWGSVGADKYRVFYKNRSGGWSKLGDTTGTSIIDSDVVYGKAYIYTVRAMNAAATAYTSDYYGPGWQYTYSYAHSHEPTAPDDDDDDIWVNGDDSSVFRTAYEEKVISLVNAERAKYGMPALSANSGAASVARLRSKEIVQSFSHTRPDGRSCFTAATDLGVTYFSAGENIAYGYETPERVVNGWMNSEGHRKNLLSGSFTKIGVGCYEDHGVLYWAQFFIGD